MLKKLVSKGDEQHTLIAYQIAFDVEENATQEFLQKVVNLIPVVEAAPKDENAMETDEVKVNYIIVYFVASSRRILLLLHMRRFDTFYLANFLSHST